MYSFVYMDRWLSNVLPLHFLVTVHENFSCSVLFSTLVEFSLLPSLPLSFFILFFYILCSWLLNLTSAYMSSIQIII